MLKKKDLEIIAALRKNARTKMPDVARKLQIPVSTIYEKITNSNGIIRKFTVLLDFKKLGYFEKSFFVVKIVKSQKTEFQQFVLRQTCLNSLYKINNGYDFIVEAVFEDMRELEKFKEELETKFSIKEIGSYNVLDDICQETFLGRIFDF